MLEIKHLSKSFGTKKAVNDITLTVPDGKIVGFIGHNGAGKTTTLRAVSGIIAFEEGEIFIDGINIKDDPLTTKTITAFIPDNPDLYDFMKGIDYLNFIADMYSVSKEDRLTRVDKYAALFDLKSNLGSPISSYSHGMKQKLALISAFLRAPQLMILDEPFVGLDPIASHSLKQELKEFCRNGNSVFFSTHVLEVAQKLCDEIVIIKEGLLIRQGQTEAVIGDKSLEEVFLGLENGARDA